MALAYLLLTHGRKHFPRRLLREHPAARQQIANIEGMLRKHTADVDIDWRWDYARDVRTLDDLPQLQNALTALRERGHGMIVIDDLQRLFVHVPLEHRGAFLEELSVFDQHLAGLRQGRALAEHTTRALLPIVVATTCRYVVNPTPRQWETTIEDRRRQTRAATVESRRVRSRRADAVAAELERLQIELLETRSSVSAAELAKEANARGLKSPRGKDWSRQSVNRALRRFAGSKDVTGGTAEAEPPAG